MIIREFETADIEGLYSLILDYKNEHKRKLTEEQKESIKRTLFMLAQSTETVCLLAEIDNRITGYINAHFLNFPLICGTECYISELIIHPDFRGKSAGSSLLKELKKRAEKKGAVRFLLNNEKNTESYQRSFYLKNGFEERTSFANFVKSL